MLRIIEFILCLVSDVTVQVQLLQLEKYGKIRTSGRSSDCLFRLVAVTELWQQSCKSAHFRHSNPSCIRYLIYHMEKVSLMSDGCIEVWTTDESESTVYAVDSVSAVANCRVCGGNRVVCGPVKEGFLFKSVRSA